MAPSTVEYGNPCGCAAGLFVHMDATDAMIHPPTSHPCMSYCRMLDIHKRNLKMSGQKLQEPKPTDSNSKMAGNITPRCCTYFNPFQSISISHLSFSPWSPGHMSAPARPWVVVPAASRRPSKMKGWMSKKWMAFDQKNGFQQELDGLLPCPLRFVFLTWIGLCHVPLKVDC